MTPFERYSALKAKGKTITEIAAICGVSRQAVSKCFKFHADPAFRKKLNADKMKAQKLQYKIDPVYREKRRRYYNNINQRKQENV